MTAAWCIFGAVILVALLGAAFARGGKILRDDERNLNDHHRR